MRTSPTSRMWLVLGLMAAGACGSFRGGSNAANSLTACFPQQCQLDVQNDNGRVIGVRYSDASTGVGELLGSVVGISVRRFTLPRRTGRNIIVDVEQGGALYRAQLTVPHRPDENVLHFPGDFELVTKG